MELDKIMGNLTSRFSRPKGDTNLAGQVALVTGSTRGLGLELARQLAHEEGCKVVICGRDAQELERVWQKFSKNGSEVLTIRCDVANRAEVEKMIEEATAHFGRIDLVINNAGVIQVGPVQQMTVEDFEAAMAIDFWGTLYTTMAVLPQMRQRKSGRIVNITSIGGRVSVPHLLPYSAAKFAATGFSEGLRTELVREGISVTTILPGLMRTGSYLNAYFKGQAQDEFNWFSLGASLPLVTIQTERAARQIIEATKLRKPERILSPQAILLAKLNGLLPNTMAHVISLINRVFLPGTSGSTYPKRGMEIEQTPVQKAVIAAGEAAAKQFDQYPGGSATLDQSREAQKNS